MPVTDSGQLGGANPCVYVSGVCTGEWSDRSATRNPFVALRSVMEAFSGSGEPGERPGGQPAKFSKCQLRAVGGMAAGGFRMEKV